MSEDLIRRSDAIDALRKLGHEVVVIDKVCSLGVAHEFIDAIRDIPSADRPPKVVAQITFGEEKLREIVKEAVERFKEEYEIKPKQGEWIPCSKEGLALTELMRREGRKWYGYKCSNCNFIYKGNALLEFNFCPNCGCAMKGADDDQ